MSNPFDTTGPVDDCLYNYCKREDGLLKLYFDPRGVQSAMREDDPWALALDYTRAMMSCLLFHPAPREVLIVGLGGGSLPKFCYRHLPGARIRTVEIDRAIIALRHTFMIPDDNERFQVIHADAVDYLQTQHESADLIMLDGFIPEGLPDALCSQSFYDSCYQALMPRGVLVANLWDERVPVERYANRLARAFDGQARVALADDGDNLIALGFKGIALPGRKELQTRARRLQEQLGLVLDGPIKRLRKPVAGF